MSEVRAARRRRRWRASRCKPCLWVGREEARGGEGVGEATVTRLPGGPESSKQTQMTSKKWQPVPKQLPGAAVVETVE